MNKEQQQIIDEVYEKYSIIAGMSTQVITLTKEEFIHYIRTDVIFSKTWGLTIEERELSLEERTQYKKKRDGIARTFAPYTHQMLDGSNIPTKLITITYNDKTIESYE
jgi:CRISPR/Cas system CMR-associated protein Cmr3 (group 5 of RAMP superfamily)